MRTRCNPLPLAVVITAVFALAACGTSGAATSSGSTPTPSGATSTPAATKGPLTLTTALCTTAITSTDVSHATGVTIISVASTTQHDTSTNQDAVMCTYMSATKPVSLITFVTAPNASTVYPQLRQYFASQSPGGVVTDVAGLGDAAFWGISSGGATTQDTSTGLVVLRGNLILEILTNGDKMLPADEQIAHIILGRV